MVIQHYRHMEMVVAVQCSFHQLPLNWLVGVRFLYQGIYLGCRKKVEGWVLDRYLQNVFINSGLTFQNRFYLELRDAQVNLKIKIWNRHTQSFESL